MCSSFETYHSRQTKNVETIDSLVEGYDWKAVNPYAMRAVQYMTFVVFGTTLLGIMPLGFSAPTALTAYNPAIVFLKIFIHHFPGPAKWVIRVHPPSSTKT